MNDIASVTIYRKKALGQNFQKISKFHKISNFSRILCNKTITTLELDQYEVLWSREQQH
jgi:hypothetical protein